MKLSPPVAAVILILLAGGYAPVRDAGYLVLTGHLPATVNQYKG